MKNFLIKNKLTITVILSFILTILFMAHNYQSHPQARTFARPGGLVGLGLGRSAVSSSIARGYTWRAPPAPAPWHPTLVLPRTGLVALPVADATGDY